MKIYREDSLTNFEFWSGAKANAEQLTCSELEQLTEILESMDCEGEGMDETAINDLMWFEFATICEWLNLDYDSDKGEIIR